MRFSSNHRKLNSEGSAQGHEEAPLPQRSREPTFSGPNGMPPEKDPIAGQLAADEAQISVAYLAANGIVGAGSRIEPNVSEAPCRGFAIELSAVCSRRITTILPQLSMAYTRFGYRK
jgi:hypothetical protein